MGLRFFILGLREMINSEKTSLVHQLVFYNKYRIYHKEALKCQWKLDVSKSIILYLIKKTHYGAHLKGKRLETWQEACSEANSRPPPSFPTFRLSYAWESRRPALLIHVIQDGGGFVMFTSAQKWSFSRPCQIIPQTQGRTAHLNPSACGGNKEQL